MTGGKFASLTAQLLVRKGEARPSPIATASIINLPIPHAHEPRPERREPPDAQPQTRIDSELLSSVVAEVLAATPLLRDAAPTLRDNGSGQERAEAEEPKPAATRRKASGGKPPPSPPGAPAKPRRLMVALSPAEFETLGHMSVKKGATRHELVRNALDEYMALLGEEYGGDCQCIYTGCSCDNPS